jgi:hypothetical protein
VRIDIYIPKDKLDLVRELLKVCSSASLLYGPYFGIYEKMQCWYYEHDCLNIIKSSYKSGSSIIFIRNGGVRYITPTSRYAIWFNDGGITCYDGKIVRTYPH